ncbi:hypothetical protein FCV25MIE_20262 [Fagus crenata]
MARQREVVNNARRILLFLDTSQSIRIIVVMAHAKANELDRSTERQTSSLILASSSVPDSFPFSIIPPGGLATNWWVMVANTVATTMKWPLMVSIQLSPFSNKERLLFVSDCVDAAVVAAGADSGFEGISNAIS